VVMSIGLDNIFVQFTLAENTKGAVLEQSASLESIVSMLGSPTLCFQDNAVSPVDKSCRRPALRH
jgi:hypothetical protein